MKRSTFISWVDALAFVAFALLISTGFLMKYALPPGSGGLESAGGGWRAQQRPVYLVWGLTRHEWGDIHFWLSVGFLVLMAAHLFLHWRWIVVSFKGEHRGQTLLQGGLGVAAILALMVFAAAPFFSDKIRVTRGSLADQRAAPAPAGESTDRLNPSSDQKPDPPAPAPGGRRRQYQEGR
jgi:hypothetical protein